MYPSTRQLLWCSFVAPPLALFGCGGDSKNQSVSTGYFVDSGVQGLGYSSLSHSGVTGPGGSFNYVPGQNVFFSLYGQPLIASTLSAQIQSNIVTPFHVNTAKVHPAYPINVMRFLLALDADSDPSNGITLPAHNGSFNVNFNQSLTDFEMDVGGNVKAFLKTYAKGQTLYPVRDTVLHFAQTLAKVGPSQNYSLAFTGKTATSVITNSKCSNTPTLTGGWLYTFGSGGFTMVGRDEFITSNTGSTCTLGPLGQLSYTYGSAATDEFLGCLPTCSYNQINRVSWIDKDADGRTAVEYSWHTPGTKEITYVKIIVEDLINKNNPQALSYFLEVITMQ